MQNNDDLINDILKELDDDKKNRPAPDEKTTNPEAVLTDELASGNDIPNEMIPEHEAQPQIFPENDSSPDEIFSQNDKTDNINDYFHNPEPEFYNEQPNIRPTERVNIPKKKKKRKKKGNRLPGVLILTTLIFAVSIILSMVIIGFGKDMLGIGKGDTTKLIIIEDGSTTEEIAQMLKDEGIIKSPKFFVMFSRLRKADSSYIAGEHFIRPNMAYETIIQNLTTDEIENKEIVEVTFPEGITILDAGAILEEKGVCSKDDFIFNFNAGGYGFAFEERLPVNSSLKFMRMEGYVFPDTYFFYEDMDPEKVCQKIYLNFENKMTEERYAKMESLNLSLDELITFASIVQKEAATTDTMITVASVFWNRLNNKDKFPRLQSDPTSNYANNVIKPNMDVYDKTMIDAYDTYEGTGLPPGAICNPGIEAIDAVLENFPTTYYYFIANIYTGKTEFAETLEEHEANQVRIEEEVNAYLASSEAAEQGGNGDEY